MSKPTPAHMAGLTTREPQLPTGQDERFTGYGVMGLAFDSGHCLALRVITAASIGSAYRAVWHRDPAGEWTIYTTAPPNLSCPRYFGAQARAEIIERIDLTWSDPQTLQVRMGDQLRWDIELRRTVATRLMTRVGRSMPKFAWRSNAVLASMGPMAGPTLRVGRLNLRGATPNRQQFQAAPVRVWAVSESRAELGGTNLGAPAGLEVQAKLGDFWLPQRGIFYVGDARFEALDPARHIVTDPAIPRSTSEKGAVR